MASGLEGALLGGGGLDIRLWVLAAALAGEAVLGYPPFLYRSLGHPVTWMGALIGRLDAALNHEGHGPFARRVFGVSAILLVAGLSAAAGLVVEWGVARWVEPQVLALVVAALLAGTLLAPGSLDRHVRDVAVALEAEGLAGGRRMVARIVGRDPETLDEAGVARAAIESLAENFSDGVTAPAFWLAIGGLPGGAAYKAINTADSMIGHRTARHEAFGWAAARLDDVVNLPASRLTALLLVMASVVVPGASAVGAARAVWRDAGRHRSPNAGWPEAAMAGALGLKLAGPRSYGGVMVEDAFMGDGRREATAGDIRLALVLYRVAVGIGWGVVAACAIWLLCLGSGP